MRTLNLAILNTPRLACTVVSRKYPPPPPRAHKQAPPAFLAQSLAEGISLCTDLLMRKKISTRFNFTEFLHTSIAYRENTVHHGRREQVGIRIVLKLVSIEYQTKVMHFWQLCS